MTKQKTFKAPQRAALAAEGLVAEQIDWLERRALPTVAAFKHDLPPKSEIRKRVQTVSIPLTQMVAAMAELESASFPDDTPDGPALDRIVLPTFRREEARALPAMDALAAYDLLYQSGVTPDLMSQLRNLAQLVSFLEQQIMARGPQRKRASWQPIEAINEALLRGFIEYEQAQGRGIVRHGEWDTSTPHCPMRPYEPLTVSNSGPFGRVAKICFMAAGIHASPDKNIRAWQARDDARRRRSVEDRLNEALPEGERHRPQDLEFLTRKRGNPAFSRARRAK